MNTIPKSLSVNGVEYSIVKLLGSGKGGYSYLAQKDGKTYVLKQIHHEPCEYYSFGNKIEAENTDYKRLLDCDIRIPRMLDVDTEKERILKEYIEGDTIYHKVLHDDMKDKYEEFINNNSTFLFLIFIFSISFSNSFTSIFIPHFINLNFAHPLT